MFSNIGGTATQIGDPPNIIIGAQLSRTSLAGTPLAEHSIAFIDFVINLAPAVFLVFLPSLWLLHRLEREGLDLHRERDIESLRETYGVKDKSLLIKSGIIFFVFARGSRNPNLFTKRGSENFQLTNLEN